MKRKVILVFLLGLLDFNANAQRDYTQYVLPQMGSQSEFSLSNGNLYPAIARPWGMNHWAPQTATNDNRWFYSYNSYQITGLRQTHQPSPWIGDYGVFSLLPTVGEKKFKEEERKSWFSHKAEEVHPFYYKVYLADYNVTAEMTPTERSCIMRFTFPKTKQANVVIDAFAKNAYIKVIPEESKIIGYSTDCFGYEKQRIPSNFKNYFVITFDKEIANYAIWDGNQLVDNIQEATGIRNGAVITFATNKGEEIQARIASSFISWQQAELNLQQEIGKQNFDEVCIEGKKRWNEELSRFAIADNGLNDLDKVRTFYSCLYRTLLFPRAFHETDAAGKIIHYSPYNGTICDGRMYTDNGFWDTFRAVHPFFNLFYPTQSKYILEGLANTYKESGWLPEWAAPGHVDCMIGSNSASVVASAILNGIKEVDKEYLWQGVIKSAFQSHPEITSTGRAGIDEYIKLGYVPNDIEVKESAARTLEYAYADYCIYRLAQELKKDKKTIETFRKRSSNYRNLFYQKHRLMAGRNSKGEFRKDFNPFAWGGDFTEGNSWHYSWSVFHDPTALVQLMGGQSNFANMLDSVFSLPPVFDETNYGQVIHEIREMQIMNFGQYAHGNQPIQHVPYLYNWVGQPWKTQYWTRQIMNRLYRPTPDGYCGDEDNGQTSAWYVFSALGFYPVSPISGQYAIGSPLFKQVTLRMENGKQLRLTAENNTTENVYIQSLSINNIETNRNYITHKELQTGGEFLFHMANKPNTHRGTSPDDFPYSFSTNQK